MTTMNQMGLVPPQNLDAERAVLGAMMLNRQALLTGMEHLRSKDFYRPEHARIFTAITALFNNDSAVDLVTVSNELSRMGVLEQIGGESTVAAVCGSVASVGNVEYYCRIVQDRSLMRQMIDSCSEVMGECFRADEPARDVLSRAQGRIFELHQASGKKSFIAVKEMLSATLKAVQDFHDRKEHISGVPTGFKDLDQLTSGFQSGDLVIVAGRPSMGKCLTAHTLIDDPETGERRTIEDFVRARRSRVYGLSSEGRVEVKQVGDWIDSGVKPCFRVCTRTGRSVEVTGHHPFLTAHGWIPLRELTVGTPIAVPRFVPLFGSDTSVSRERAVIAAYLVAEGGLSAGTPRFTNTDPVLIADFKRAVDREFPMCRLSPDGISFRISHRKSHPNPLKSWLKEIGLDGKKAEHKRFPDFVWRLPREVIRDFIRVLFSCDATVYPMAGYPRIEFAAASEGLAQDVHHALVRFGIISKLWRKKERCWRVEIAEPESVATYRSEIGWEGEKASRFIVDPPARRSNVGHIPGTVWPLVKAEAQADGKSISQLAVLSGEWKGCKGYNMHVHRGIPRNRLAAYAELLGNAPLTRLASPDIYWDMIVSVEPIGDHQVYDLTVPDGSNFIAQDMCVHNTALAMNMAENVAIDPRGPRRPVGIFSLEMSTQSLVLRLLCSHARISAHRLRTGYLREDEWRTIALKAGDLDNAQIYIDDSGSSNIMEIRAKSRRLKMEHPDLAMILVDYLQLVSGLPGTENRQQEISQVSRSLKALAKELELPVVALSQLSRAVESRGNAGRPMLSDLRECVTGDTLVVQADGLRVPIRDLVGKTPEVIAMSPEGKLMRALSDKVWSVGVRPVFDVKLASGRSIRATAKHRLYGANGWVRVANLRIGDRLAVAKGIPGLVFALGVAVDRASLSNRSWADAGVAVMEAPTLVGRLGSDLYLEAIVSILPAGEEEVFDLTVPGPASWLADGIVSHNSGAIEQDADVVMFVYRPGYYKNPNERTPEEMGKAEIILAKQRNGPTGSVPLTFLPDCTRFEDTSSERDDGFP